LRFSNVDGPLPQYGRPFYLSETLKVMILFQQNRKARAKGKNVTLKLGIRRRFICNMIKKGEGPGG